MKKMKNIRNLILGLLIITTSLVSAQNDCVKRMNRYSEAPSIVTIYPCTSLEFIHPETEIRYNIAILVDSIYTTEKVYRLYCESTSKVESFIFQVELLSGELVIIFPNYTPEGGKYAEAMLDNTQLSFFKTNNIKNISIWEESLADKPNPKIPCENFFKNFVTKY